MPIRNQTMSCCVLLYQDASCNCMAQGSLNAIFTILIILASHLSAWLYTSGASLLFSVNFCNIHKCLVQSLVNRITKMPGKLMQKSKRKELNEIRVSYNLCVCKATNRGTTMAHEPQSEIMRYKNLTFLMSMDHPLGMQRCVHVNILQTYRALVLLAHRFIATSIVA